MHDIERVREMVRKHKDKPKMWIAYEAYMMGMADTGAHPIEIRKFVLEIVAEVLERELKKIEESEQEYA